MNQNRVSRTIHYFGFKGGMKFRSNSSLVVPQLQIKLDPKLVKDKNKINQSLT